MGGFKGYNSQIAHLSAGPLSCMSLVCRKPNPLSIPLPVCGQLIYKMSKLLTCEANPL